MLYEKLKSSGYKKTHILNHAFPCSVEIDNVRRTKTHKFSFVGSLVGYNSFHKERIQLLKFLSNRIAMTIFVSFQAKT